MTTRLKLRIEPGNRTQRVRPRPAWRQRLVDTERGIAQGFRLDSTMFVHLFSGITVVTAACVLQIGLLQWTVLVLALTTVLSAEMFNQVLKTLFQHDRSSIPKPILKALRIATAAVFVTIVGAVVSIGLIFAHRLREILAG